VQELITALGLAVAIEGALYALFPATMKRVLREALEQPENVLRMAGLAAAAGGVVIIWLIRS
jgi:uncharacterized protein YjeT (DUF2065 family)